ncbi:alanine racemase [Daejeonella lutea]|uniref:Alanine racemase n=1 Tax=Daejeonella lutea TaxID=572036 RepID=A0A1T5BCV5_9SPHI|nr:alanine racemase [Daejeonella lutea]SKB44830.1 alanine racemase [Daejeonella lutea]
MTQNFRHIPDEAFGSKAIVRIRDIDAVVHNYNLFKAKADATGTICAAVLKGDVYGLQIKDVAPALYNAGARYFFIEELGEGIELRGLLPYDNIHIYALGGLLHNEEAYFKRFDIVPCLNSLEQLKRWNSYCKNHGKGSAIIHLDTHMNRLGFLDDEVLELSENFEILTSHLEIEFYISHFFDIKGSDPSNCYKQLDVLNDYRSKLPFRPVSFACTDSVILLDNKIFNFDMIRPGIGLVGGAPNANSPISPDARHTMEVYAKISQIKTVKQGETIGYGGAYKTKRDIRLALVHIGYKHGYLRLLSEIDSNPKGVYMFIAGYKIPVIGKISSGATTVDVTDVPEEILDKYHYAEVIGPNVDIKFLADISGCYDILGALGVVNSRISDYTLDAFNNKNWNS